MKEGVCIWFRHEESSIWDMSGVAPRRLGGWAVGAGWRNPAQAASVSQLSRPRSGWR